MIIGADIFDDIKLMVFLRSQFATSKNDINSNYLFKFYVTGFHQNLNNMKKKYDSSVVFLYATGNERLLPHDFRKQIPYSTISTWRKADYTEYLGNEFRSFFDEAFESAEISYKYKRLKRTMMGLARSWITLSSAIAPVLKNAKKDKKLQSDMLNAIRYMREHIGLERSLKLLGLNRSLYQQWILEARFKCFDSFSALCVKRHPYQLELDEITKMKKMLTDPKLHHWPIVSIAALALRKKRIVASLFSWYKYARIHNITKKLVKKDKKTIGLLANWPNEYLHVDTTYYPLTSGQKICIAFVMDNYSKMILGFHAAENLSFDVVKQALKKALEVIQTHPDQEHSFLVADGGRENHNKQIDKFITELSGHKITKIRALRDIRFSNSPVEAVHRTMKGRYLRNQKFDTIDALIKYIEWAVMDYNVLRPHYKHRPKTPQEVYFNKPLGFDIKKRVKQALQTRIQNNQCAKCIQCKGAKADGSCAGKVNCRL